MLLVCVMVLVLLLSCLYLRSRRVLSPPGPPSIPLLGSLPFLTTRRGLFDWALDTPVTKHRLTRVRFGPKTFYIINDYELAKELFNREEFSGRTNQPFGLEHKFFSGQPQGIVSTEGTVWDAQRRFGLKTLKSFGYGKKSLEETINIEADEVIKRFFFVW